MKELSIKQWFWTLIFTLPLTFYAIELLFGDTHFTPKDFFFHMVWSVIGVIMGYWLSTKLFAKYRHIKGINAITYFLLFLLVIGISALINLTGLRELKPLISEAFMLPLIVSAITLNSVIAKPQNS